MTLGPYEFEEYILPFYKSILNTCERVYEIQ